MRLLCSFWYLSPVCAICVFFWFRSLIKRHPVQFPPIRHASLSHNSLQPGIKYFLQGILSQLTACFQTAVCATVDWCNTLGETYYPPTSPHLSIGWLVSDVIDVIDREVRVCHSWCLRAWPGLLAQTPIHRWLWYHQALNSWSPDDRTNSLLLHHSGVSRHLSILTIPLPFSKA